MKWSNFGNSLSLSPLPIVRCNGMMQVLPATNSPMTAILVNDKLFNKNKWIPEIRNR